MPFVSVQMFAPTVVASIFEGKLNECLQFNPAELIQKIRIS